MCKAWLIVRYLTIILDPLWSFQRLLESVDQCAGLGFLAIRFGCLLLHQHDLQSVKSFGRFARNRTINQYQPSISSVRSQPGWKAINQLSVGIQRIADELDFVGNDDDHQLTIVINISRSTVCFFREKFNF